MKNNKGLTLIELLAVIAIIGLLTAIIIPSYNTIKKKAATQTYQNKIELLKTAAYKYGMDNINDVKANPSDYEELTISFLIQNGYITSDAKNTNVLINPLTSRPMTEIAKLTYTNNKILVVIFGGDATEFTLTIDLNDGSSTNNSTYLMLPGEPLTLDEPTRDYYEFAGWNISNSSSTLNGNYFVMGNENITVTANWDAISFDVIVVVNEGIWDGVTPQTKEHGKPVAINKPTKAGYVFGGWRRNDNNELITTTSFTMPSNDITLAAEWITFDIDLDEGEMTSTLPLNISSGDAFEITNPTRENHIFKDWTVTGANSAFNGTEFTMGTDNTTITANWILIETTFSTSGSFTYPVPINGNYKLEVWGAQGATAGSYAGGKGGYAVGTVALNVQSTPILYVVVGGQPSSTNAGYNGGGTGYYQSDTGRWGAGGGGATHIASAAGVLSTLSSNKGAVFIVAGGGGGGATGDYNAAGGTGGGTSGGSGGGLKPTGGGTQSSGTSVAPDLASFVTGYNDGIFGKGGNGYQAWGAGGGGGWYGAGGSQYASAGGGSGYIGNVTGGSMSNGTRAGSGYAKITYLGST